MTEEDKDKSLTHVGVRGMRWGVRNADPAGGSSKGKMAAQKTLSKRESETDKADTEVANTWGTGKKAEAAALKKLDDAISAENTARFALKEASKSPEVRAASKKLKEVLDKVDKADTEVANTWGTGKKAEAAASKNFEKTISEEHMARKALRDAKLKPQNEKVAKAKEAYDAASKKLDKLDNDWVKAYDKNGGKEDGAITNSLNAARTEHRKATANYIKEKANKGVASAIVFVEGIFEN